MKVITLETSLFKAICHKLAQKVGNSFHPHVVIAILNGGGHVAREMYSTLNRKSTVLYGEVSACRPGTALKQKKSTRSLLASMPRFLLNWARIAESYFLRLFPRTDNRNISFDSLNDNIIERISQGNCNILIVDDAIDSGATMNGVIKALNEQYPGNNIKTAAITVTTSNPLLNVDFKIFKNRELVRFPWSKDMKQ